MVEVKRYTIGEIGFRANIATSALRYYEENGLIRSERSPAGHRRYRPDVLRRVAFIHAAQQVGLSLTEIGKALSTLPEDRAPTRAEWAALSASWRPRLDEQIRLLEHLRDDLDECIGCGCLSLPSCRVYNPNDQAAELGAGARYLLGDPKPPAPKGAKRTRAR